jgi:A/G-specific adenine glycosylase
MGHCAAFKQGNPKDYPGKKAKKKLPIKTAYFLMLSNERGELLLEQNPPIGLWGGLWVFPQCESEAEIAELYLRLGVRPEAEEIFAVKRHTFSHFHLDYQPVRATIASAVTSALQVAESPNQVWYNPQNPLSLGMPAPIKALLANIA